MPVSGSKRTFEFLQHTCPAGPGNDGSPLLDPRGKVVAVANCGTLARLDGTTIAPESPVTYAVNVRYLRELVKRHYPHVEWN